jgi:hypothetical protein
MTIEEYIQQLESNKKDMRFAHLVRICQEQFGNPRMKGSHHIFKTPWSGDPRINLQADERNAGKAKPYQVKQVIAALRKLQEMQQSEEKGEASHAAE